MTAAEMLVRFEQKLKESLDKDFDIQRFTMDVSYYLTVAQRNLVEEYYKIFELDEKARKTLAPLVYNVDLTRGTYAVANKTGCHPHGEYWNLSTLNILYTLKEEATINRNQCGEYDAVSTDWTRVYVRPINLDYYNKHIQNPFKKPYSGMIWRMDITNGTIGYHELIVEGITGERVEIYHLTYLKAPTAISVEDSIDCILSDWVHEEIVNEAVRLALITTQTNNQLNKTSN